MVAAVVVDEAAARVVAVLNVSGGSRTAEIATLKHERSWSADLNQNERGLGDDVARCSVHEGGGDGRCGGTTEMAWRPSPRDSRGARCSALDGGDEKEREARKGEGTMATETKTDAVSMAPMELLPW
ncbi:hypothetical protein RIF29_38784 [Crotalaria pallida]|uniref:Uncharacterized protein n=1 Tax=Crotalaria pallida TaxID=3830 RepID=A0AAN9E0G7_CROPI